jgi:toxin ParE1/3/4
MLGPNARIAIISPYLLIYDYSAKDDAVTLLRILHERRNITQELIRGG